MIHEFSKLAACLASVLCQMLYKSPKEARTKQGHTWLHKCTTTICGRALCKLPSLPAVFLKQDGSGVINKELHLASLNERNLSFPDNTEIIANQFPETWQRLYTFDLNLAT